MTIFTTSLDDVAVLLGTSAFTLEDGADFEPCFGGRFDAEQRWIRDEEQARHGGVPLWQLPVRAAIWRAGSGSVRRTDDRLVVPSPTQPSVADLSDQLDLFGGSK